MWSVNNLFRIHLRMDQMCWIKDVSDVLNAKLSLLITVWCECVCVKKNVEECGGKSWEGEEEREERRQRKTTMQFLDCVNLPGDDRSEWQWPALPSATAGIIIRRENTFHSGLSKSTSHHCLTQLYTKLALMISLLSFRKKIFSPKIGMMFPTGCSDSEVLPSGDPPAHARQQMDLSHLSARSWRVTSGWHPRALPWKHGRWPGVPWSSGTDCAELPTLPALLRGKALDQAPVNQ